ncbi:hypothetical protein ABB37_04603 [Leptomonas pyrrhocoris]|uniref:Uncharacterized protein n=1 Tax=Leptomonas pyrrhocoris TaxID=157538 RepID=A0A0M9G186_LEPPY|nr:hypothetical protein ABB37_04603 [Leptomonas pyrrhocoris]KPA80330.1 hypothetical protein ABB37_04603 [Leptomonas pyrrhocoris]|eukprot:XP_015658769.1 hypothetical protein ABB37_04603 [Leptomonas pyrrhocoris]
MSPPGNFSAIRTRSAQFSPDTSLVRSGSFLQPAGGESPPSPLKPSQSPAAPPDAEAEAVEPLTVSAVNRFVQRLQQLEDREGDEPARQADTAAMPVERNAVQPCGEPSPPTHPATTPAQSDDEVTDSEDLEVCTAHTARQVRAFLNDLKDGDFSRGPSPVPRRVVDSAAEEIRQQQERLATCSSAELRTLALELHTELVCTLYDAVTLEANVIETDEDAAVLERAVDERDETIELLRVQLSTTMDDNVDLHDGKEAALRKLRDAKTEMALLSQRYAKLLKQLDLKKEELQLSLNTSLSNSQRTSLAMAGRRDVGTLTEVFTARRGTHDLSVSTTEAAAVDDSPLSLSGRSRSGVHSALEETQDELRLARHTLYETEMDRLRLQEQLQELREATMRSDNWSSYSTYAERCQDEMHGAARQSVEERCERSEERAAYLEKKVSELHEELRTLKAPKETGNEFSVATAAVADVERSAIHAAPSSDAVTSTDSSSQVLLSESRGSSTGRSGARTPLSLSQTHSISTEAQMVVLQRQLARAKTETAHLEQELRKEREKTQRQSQSEKKLLDSVKYLTQQLRAREAQERDARSHRRSEAGAARGDGEGESGSNGRRGSYSTMDRASYGGFSQHEESSSSWEIKEDSGINKGEVNGAAGSRQNHRHATTELPL